MSPILVIDDDEEEEILPSSRTTRPRNTSQPLAPNSSKQRGGATLADRQSETTSPRSKTGPTRLNVDSSPDVKITHVRSTQPRNHGEPPNIRSSRPSTRREQLGSGRLSSSSTKAENIINLTEDDAEIIEERAVNPSLQPTAGKLPPLIGQPLSEIKRTSVQHGSSTISDSCAKPRAPERPPATRPDPVIDTPEGGIQSFRTSLEFREPLSRHSELDQTSTAPKANQTVLDDEIGVLSRVSPISNSTSPDKEQAALSPRKEVRAKTPSTVSGKSALHNTTYKTAIKANVPTSTAKNWANSTSVPGSPLRKAPVQAAIDSPESTAAKETLKDLKSDCLEEHDIMDVDLGDRQEASSVRNSELTVAAMEQFFHKHIRELQDDHKYFMKSWLQRARRASNKERPSVSLNPSTAGSSTADNLTRQPPRFAQNMSPFANMRAIEIPNPVKGTEPAVPCGKLNQFILKTHSGKPETRNFTVPVTSYNSEAITIPSYTSYITLSRNVLAANDKDMKYFPYFGEDVNVEKGALFKELEQTFNNRVKDLPLCRLRAEQADKFRPYAKAALEELGCGMNDILRYLLEDERPSPMVKMSMEARDAWLDRAPHLEEDFNREEIGLRKVLADLPPRDEQAVAVAGLACRAFLNVTEFSLWHIAKSDEGIFTAGLPGKLSQATMGSTTEAHAGATVAAQSLETYSDLGCLICHVHDCPGHGEYEEPSEDSDLEEQLGGNRRIRVTTSAPTDVSKPQEIKEYKMSLDGLSVFEYLGKNSDGTITGTIPKNQTTREKPSYADNQECSIDCFWKKENRVEAVPHWSEDRLDLFHALLPAWIDSRRGPCMIAWAVEKPCSEVFTMIHSSTRAKLRGSKLAIDRSLRYGPKRKPQYWLDNSITWNHEKRKPFVPCSHVGSCETAICSCFEEKVQCEKSCTCSWGCQRRFQGCNCAQTARACWQNDKCDCFSLNRECDEDLCRSCGATEVLDPVNRYNDDIAKVRCCNVYMQRGVPKHTLLGDSEIQGFGLYMGESVTAGEFLGEYKGEVLSKAEADRRGAIYAQRETCYLFTLNAGMLFIQTSFQYVATNYPDAMQSR